MKGDSAYSGRYQCSFAFVIGTSGLCFYAVFLGGLASNNKWSILGAARGLVSIISYESVGALALIAIIMLVGSFLWWILTIIKAMDFFLAYF